MVTNSNSSDTKTIKIQDALIVVLISVFLGLVSGFVHKSVVGIIWTVILVSIGYAYHRIVGHNKAILNGLIVGSGLGTAVGIAGWLIGGGIQGPGDGALFGLLRGILVGAAVGVVTRANSEEGDTQETRFLIIGGSILFGVVLGGLIGLTTGIILGYIGEGMDGAVRATVAGSILGASIGSYFKEVRWIALVATSLAVLAAVSALLGGAVAGVVVGAISGSFAPILLVSGIGAFGGLTSRGLKAMIVEALEAPIEMMEQGAVPFLAPALIIGMIIGAVASGMVGIMALAFAFAFLGLFFGILSEIVGGSSQITVRSMVEVAMLGAETWPIRRVLEQIRSEPKQAAIGAVMGAALALAGAMAGVELSKILLNFIMAA